jgi:hypothetical protein
MLRPIPLLLFAISIGLSSGCHPKAKSPPKEAEPFALAFIGAARAGAIGPEWVDDALVERVRRVQRLELVGRARAPAEVMAKVWATKPDPHVAPAERGRLQRERAAQALSGSLHGECTAKRDPAGAIGRIGALTAKLDKAPADAQAELARLGTDLTGAELVRVRCEKGAVGLLMVPRASSFQVVDLFAVNENRAPFKLPAAGTEPPKQP